MQHVVVGIITRKNEVGETEYLLSSSTRDFGKYTGAFYPPGGHLEEGEDERTALIRELHEEFNVKVELDEKIAETSADVDVPDQKTHWWRCRIVGGELRPNQKQVAHWGWYTEAQALQLYLWPKVRDVLFRYVFDNR